eukprot:5080677-Amphidinium_carterae.1
MSDWYVIVVFLCDAVAVPSDPPLLAACSGASALWTDAQTSLQCDRPRPCHASPAMRPKDALPHNQSIRSGWVPFPQKVATGVWHVCYCKKKRTYCLLHSLGLQCNIASFDVRNELVGTVAEEIL